MVYGQPIRLNADNVMGYITLPVEDTRHKARYPKSASGIWV